MNKKVNTSWVAIIFAFGGFFTPTTAHSMAAAKAAADVIVDGAAIVGQVVADAWGNLVTIHCSGKQIRGFRAICFDHDSDTPNASRYIDRIDKAIALIERVEADGNSFIRGSGRFAPQDPPFRYNPIQAMRKDVGVIQNGESWAIRNLFAVGWARDMDSTNAEMEVTNGSASGRLTLWPLGYENYPTSLGLASVLIHEADHVRFGTHTSGHAADEYENGPYGTQIRFYAAMARSNLPEISDLDRTTAAWSAMRKLRQVANPTSKQNLFNYTFRADAPRFLLRGCKANIDRKESFVRCVANPAAASYNWSWPTNSNFNSDELYGFYASSNPKVFWPNLGFELCRCVSNKQWAEQNLKGFYQPQ